MWMLTLFKPWRKSVEELKHSDGTYKSTLEDYMYDAQFPKRILAVILRAKRNEKAVVVDESPFHQESVGTPTSDRQNETFDCAVDAVISPPTQDNEEEIEDMDENLFLRLKDRTPDNYDWSKNYVSGQAEKLTLLGKSYYEKKNNIHFGQYNHHG